MTSPENPVAAVTMVCRVCDHHHSTEQWDSTPTLAGAPAPACHACGAFAVTPSDDPLYLWTPPATAKANGEPDDDDDSFVIPDDVQVDPITGKDRSTIAKRRRH